MCLSLFSLKQCIIKQSNESAFSFNTQEGIPSGPDALFVLSADRLKTQISDGEDLVGKYTRAHARVH